MVRGTNTLDIFCTYLQLQNVVWKYVVCFCFYIEAAIPCRHNNLHLLLCSMIFCPEFIVFGDAGNNFINTHIPATIVRAANSLYATVLINVIWYIASHVVSCHVNPLVDLKTSIPKPKASFERKTKHERHFG